MQGLPLVDVDALRSCSSQVFVVLSEVPVLEEKTPSKHIDIDKSRGSTNVFSYKYMYKCISKISK